MTREELIGIAADAILRYEGHSPEKAHPAYALLAVQQATAALEAVGAWQTREALKGTANYYLNGADCWCDHGRGPLSHSDYCLDASAVLAIAEKRS